MRRYGWLAGLLAVELVGIGSVGASTSEDAYKVYQAAESQYVAGRWAQALPLLQDFVSKYRANENFPVAYMQIATCQRHLKQMEDYEKTLDDILRFCRGSRAWYCAHGARLERLKAEGKHEEYVSLVESMARQSGQALPLQIGRNLARKAYDFVRAEYYRGIRVGAGVGRMGDTVPFDRWYYILDVVEMVQTDQQARAMLTVLGSVWRTHDELPIEWQYGHVELLRKAGQSDQADAAWRKYLEEWGDDPRAAGLWMLRAKVAQDRSRRLRERVLQARKDARKEGKEGEVESVAELQKRIEEQETIAATCWEQVLAKWKGWGCLRWWLHDRLAHLYATDQYRRYVELARVYLDRYHYERDVYRVIGHVRSRGHSPGQVLGWWRNLSEKGPEAEREFRAREALKCMEEYPAGASFQRQLMYLGWQRDMHMRLGDMDAALQAVKKLCSKTYWSAGAFGRLRHLASQHEAFRPLLKEVRAQYGIPAEQPGSPADQKLDELRKRLRDDQTRHAEEIGEELFRQHRNTAEAIQAVAALANYYYGKVLAKPRDKWMGRMIEAYPYHPATESMLRTRYLAMEKERRYDKAAEAAGTRLERFPGSATDYYSSSALLRALAASKQYRKELEVAHRLYDGQIEAGSFAAAKALAELRIRLYPTEEMKVAQWDREYAGDIWMDLAGKVGNEAAKIRCLRNAYYEYYIRPYHPAHPLEVVHFDKARNVLATLRAQTVDPELAWKLEFAEITSTCHEGKPKEALRLLEEKLQPRRTYRDLSLRLDFSALGVALGKANMLRGGMNVVGRLKTACPSPRDQRAIEMLQARMFDAAGEHRRALRHYMDVLYATQRPEDWASVWWASEQARRGAGLRNRLQELRKYAGKIRPAKALLGRVLWDDGAWFVRTKKPDAVRAVERLFSSMLPASGYPYLLGQRIEAIEKAHREEQRNRQRDD